MDWTFLWGDEESKLTFKPKENVVIVTLRIYEKQTVDTTEEALLKGWV